MTYSNGYVPDAVVSVVLASGTDENGYWEFRCTPAFAARWAFAKAYALKHFGRTIFIRTGWNIYRPIASQRVARANACAAGNCAGAAVAGSSSHGGNWNGRDCLAVDVDPNGLTWDQVDEAMSAAGFAVQQITEAMSGISGGERWHYIDFAAFGAVPAFTEETEFTPEPEEEDMSYSIINTTDGKIMLVSLVTGKRAHIGSPYHVTLLQRQRKNDPVDVMLEAELDVTGAYLLAVNPPVNATVDTAALAAALGKIDAAQDAAVVKQAVKDALAEATFKTTVS